jgi:hypothetical protein
MLGRSLDGVDRGALYQAVRAGLKNDDGRARGSIGSVYRNLSAEDIKLFLYKSKAAGGPAKQEYIHFEGLLVKRGDRWKILMENQKGPATQAEWDALE